MRLYLINVLCSKSLFKIRVKQSFDQISSSWTYHVLLVSNLRPLDIEIFDITNDIIDSFGTKGSASHHHLVGYNS